MAETTTDTPDGGLLRLHEETVRREWVDYNGHMNVAYFVLAFDHATDALLDHLGLGEAYRHRTDHSVFVVESHVNYLSEVAEGHLLTFTTQLLGHDRKRVHFYHTMYLAPVGDDEPVCVATTEIMSLHVNLRTRRSALLPPWALAKLDELDRMQEGLAHPSLAGRTMALPSH